MWSASSLSTRPGSTPSKSVRGGKVRRARLYYLRERFGRAARIKERPLRPRPAKAAAPKTAPAKKREAADAS